MMDDSTIVTILTVLFGSGGVAAFTAWLGYKRGMHKDDQTHAEKLLEHAGTRLDQLTEELMQVRQDNGRLADRVTELERTIRDKKSENTKLTEAVQAWAQHTKVLSQMLAREGIDHDPIPPDLAI